MLTGSDPLGSVDSKATKTSHNSIVIGRSNDAASTDFSSAAFDDIAMWEADIRDSEDNESVLLLGADCGQDDDLRKYGSWLLTFKAAVNLLVVFFVLVMFSILILHINCSLLFFKLLLTF